MCAHGPTQSDPTQSQAGGTEEGSTGGTAPAPVLEGALRELAEALAARKVDPICSAYLAVERVARGLSQRDLLAEVEAAAGPAASGAIISAFSHRKCFMCEDGTMPCRTCDGSGSLDRFPCPSCQGLGVEACAFCQGTGWNDRQETPEELRRAVLLRQVRHVEKDLSRLATVCNGRTMAGARRMPVENRREIAGWLIRLQARTADVAASLDGMEPQQVARFGAAAAAIGKVLDILRPRAAPPSKEPREDK